MHLYAVALDEEDVLGLEVAVNDAALVGFFERAAHLVEDALDASLAGATTALDAEDREVCDLAWFSLPRPAQAPR